MENMDWGDVFEFVSFGNVGSDHLDESAYYVIVAPQNVVGSTIMTKLLEMVRSCFWALDCTLAHLRVSGPQKRYTYVVGVRHLKKK